MGEFSVTHLLLLFLIVLIFFGPGRLPALGKSLGEAIRGFKKGLDTNPPPADNNQAQRQGELPKTEDARYTDKANQTKKETT
jgi:sec-independent protein translocase protein TatA